MILLVLPRCLLPGDRVHGRVEELEELVVGASTVKTHVSALLDKFGVTNRVQLAVAVAECTVDDVPR